MEVVAWAGLVVSWVLLALVLKFFSITLRVLRDLRALTAMTRDAARELAANVADEDVLRQFAEVERLAARLPATVRRLPSGPASSRTQPAVSSVSPGIGGRTS
jgi:hypothetical protein